MSKKHLLRDPHDVPSHQLSGAEYAWWYEEIVGICVVVQPPPYPSITAQVTIPWSQIRAALRRKDRKP